MELIRKEDKSALVFGASGVSGWGVVNELLRSLPEGLWKKIHALTNRPLTREDALWPNDSMLNVVSGIDLLQESEEDLERTLKDKVEGIECVTHVYYCAYKRSANKEREMRDAILMFQNAITAMHRLSPNLEFVVLQTGYMIYGCHLLDNRPADSLRAPLSEDIPGLRLPNAFHHYYHQQLEWISEYAQNKSWNWCETRPDVIVGFNPRGNHLSLAKSLSIFLSLFKEIEGPNSRCPFPGSEKSWEAKSNDSSSDMIARQAIHLSLTLPLSRKGEAFNVADAKKAERWSSKWPQLCQYFDLVGTPPRSEEESVELSQYIETNLETWRQMEKKYHLKSSVAEFDRKLPGFEYSLLKLFDFDRQYDMTKIYETGFYDERTAMQAWGITFDRMRAAKIIP